MPYITSASQQQVGRGQFSGAVRVSWVFGNLVPDIVEVRRVGTETTPATLLASVPINREAKTPTSIDVTVSAPTFLSLVVSPRIVQDGTLTNKMPDDAGQSVYWESFSVYLPFFAVAADTQPPVPNPTQNPMILGVVVGEGVFTVTWSSPKVDHYNATLIPSLVPWQGQIELEGGDRAFTRERVPSGKYRFSLQGCTEGILYSNCGDWIGIDIVMPQDLGFQAWRRWFPIHRETVFDHTTQQVTAVSRSPGQLDLFVIGFDNAVWSIPWSQDGGWHSGGWFPIHGETVFDHTTQQVTAVSRSPGQLDLFVIGFDNAVWSIPWSQDGGWHSGGWFPIHRETVFDHTTQQVTAVSRSPGQLDLFVIGFDNAVWSIPWSQDGGWHSGGWFPIHGETVFDHTTQQVTAVSRSSGQLDLFVIGFDNAVWSIPWSQETGWNQFGWFPIRGETVFDHTTQQVTAVSRSSGQLDLFVIGFDNAVWSIPWSQETGWNQFGWFPIRGETVFDHTTQRVTAVSRSPGQLDLFVVGFDNAVWSIPWSQQTGWNQFGWFSIHGETVFDHTTQQVTAVSRSPDQLDLFLVGFDNAVWRTFWD